MYLGKTRQLISLLASGLITVSVHGQAEKSHKYHLKGDLQENCISSEKQSIIINYSIPELNINDFQTENGSFYRISIPGHIPSSATGKPELPVFSRLISIPEGCKYKIRISDVSVSKIKPLKEKFKGMLYPSQEGETKGTQKQKTSFSIDKATYQSEEFIASDTVKIEPLGITRNTQLANLYISPVRYNPHSNVLEVITSMKVVISFSDDTKTISKSLSSGDILFDKSLSKEVLNYNKSDVINGYSDQPVKMIILTDTTFKKHLEPFIRWKTQEGYKVKVLYRGTAYAGESYTELKNTLANIYNASTETDLPPQYLLIIGNVSKIPYYGTGNVTDMYYGEFTGNNDYIPEMYIGRLPVADTTELKTVTNKIIQYEKFEFADTNKFYSNGLVTPGYDEGYANIMNGHVKYAVTNYLIPANKINESHFYYSKSTHNTDSIKVRKDSILKIINTGTSFINYTGHGVSKGWLNIEIDTSDIRKLTNINKYPFIISNACQTSKFSTGSFGNKMVVSKDKGAIGFIGCSNDSYWYEDFYWAVGPGAPSAEPTYETTGLGAYDRLFHTHEETPSDWYYSMGQINYAGNMAVSASTSTRKKYYWETYNLVGDPSMVPIMGNPGTFNISLSDTLPNGLKSLSLNTEPFAYASVSHFDTLWDASFVSASGSVMLDLPGLSDDSCMVVLTGQNKIPFIKTVYFSNINKEYLTLVSSVINDSLDNNNGRVDYGESFFLKLTISNLGLTDASNLYAILSSDSGWATIKNDSVKINTLGARSEIILSDKFEITISGNIPDMKIIPFNLILKDETSEKHFIIDVCVHAPDLHIVSCRIDDTGSENSDLTADPGENFNLVFRIRNDGSSDASGILDVFSQSSELTINEASVKSGILKFGEVTDISVAVKLSSLVQSGTSISVSSFLNCDPYITNKDFSFRVGKIRESFEAESFKVFPWINRSLNPWIITNSDSYDGIISARSGSIPGNSQSTLSIRASYLKADSLKFQYKVSSETNYDFLIFKLNDSEIFKISGETGWVKKSVPVAEGFNKMEWIYSKDESWDVGDDCAWIDMIDFSVSGSVQYIKKDLEVAKIATPVLKDKMGRATITLKLLNLGQDTISNFNLAYSVNDHYPIVMQNFNKPLPPSNDSVTVSFATKADMVKLGVYNIIAYGLNNDDDYPMNDTVRISIENSDIPDSLIVFPNPFTDKLSVFIISKVSDKLRISVTNISGSKVYITEKDIIAGKNEITITDLKLAPSLYYLNIRGTTINKTIPVMKVIR